MEGIYNGEEVPEIYVNIWIKETPLSNVLDKYCYEIFQDYYDFVYDFRHRFYKIKDKHRHLLNRYKA